MGYNFGYYGQRQPDKSLAEQLLHPLPAVVGVDVETISKENRTPIGLSIAVSPDEALYFPLLPEISPMFPWHVIADPSIKKVYHNAMFDLSALLEYDPDTSNIADTLILAHLACMEGGLDMLDHLVGKEVVPAKELIAKYGSMLNVPQEELSYKCCIDAATALALYFYFQDKVDMDYADIEFKVIPILIKMSKRGIKIDQEVRERMESKLQKAIDFDLSVANGMGFNPGSPKQVAYMLAKSKIFLPYTRSKRSLRTDEATLRRLDHPIATVVLGYRENSYLQSHYIMPLRRAHRVYSYFHMDAITGRISSSDRNLQNLPQGEVRNMLLPDSSIWTTLDYNQQELRILAFLSQDDELVYNYETGGDIHQLTADFMGIPRLLAKSVNFSMIYGATPETIMETAGIMSLVRASQLIEMWFAKYKTAGLWIKEQQERGIADLKVKTIMGRTIALPALESPEAIKRKAVNYTIQGSGAEIMKRAMIKCSHLDIALQVYDSLLIDGKVELPGGLDCVSPVKTPVKVEYLKCWE